MEKLPINDEIYEEVSELLNVPAEEVERIAKAQSSVLLRIFRRQAFESVLFPYLGKFKPRLRQIERADEKRATK